MLSQTEISNRLIRLTNLERLHAGDQKAKADLRAEVKTLKSILAETTARFEALLEAQAARITELETEIYGRKPKGGKRSSAPKSTPKQPRDAASYRRPKPADDIVTSEHHHAITGCHHCGAPLTDKQEYSRFIEDIILAALSNTSQFRTVEKHTVVRGWCVPCGKYSSAADLRGQDVTLGPNVRSLVCYLITLRDHSYDQVIRLLWDLYGFKMTSGEITTILNARSLQLLPEYERLKQTIRASPAVHLDESRWRIQSEGGAGYAFSMSSSTNTDVVFKLADSRGKGNAEELLGDNYQGVGITDRYGAYKHMFTLHQICWAHLQRNAKDLTHLECLGRAKLKHVTNFYQELAGMYASIRCYQSQPFEQEQRDGQAMELLEQALQLCRPHLLDPKKLKDLKQGILDYQDCLFICLKLDGIPADNNRAERDIRKLVMKRKKSLGVKTIKGARTLEVLLSVCWSLYNRDRNNFFANFQALTA